MTNELTIVYTYRLKNGAIRTFDLLLDKGTLALAPGIHGASPAWARLGYHQCPHCPLDIAQHPFCPIAENLSGIAEAFRDRSSLDEVHVDVDVEERRYAKDTTVQHGLSPLWGIIMTTSGCPVMEPLKPMVRYHLRSQAWRRQPSGWSPCTSWGSSSGSRRGRARNPAWKGSRGSTRRSRR